MTSNFYFIDFIAVRFLAMFKADNNPFHAVVRHHRPCDKCDNAALTVVPEGPKMAAFWGCGNCGATYQLEADNS